MQQHAQKGGKSFRADVQPVNQVGAFEAQEAERLAAVEAHNRRIRTPTDDMELRSMLEPLTMRRKAKVTTPA